MRKKLYSESGDCSTRDKCYSATVIDNFISLLRFRTLNRPLGAGSHLVIGRIGSKFTAQTAAILFGSGEKFYRESLLAEKHPLLEEKFVG